VEFLLGESDMVGCLFYLDNDKVTGSVRSAVDPAI